MSSFSANFPGTPLPNTFKPSMHTVIIGRGKMPKQHIGNKRLTVLATSFLEKYQQGDRKTKTQIVSDIICMIREASGNGGKGAFVKHDKKTGKWFDQDSSIAREKIGYVFRDLLSDQYLSSSKSKVAQRQQGRWQRRSRSTQHQQQVLTPPALVMVSDDETSSVGSNTSYGTTTTPDFSLSSQQSPIPEATDILIESTNFLDDFPEFQQTAPEVVSLDSSERSEEDFMESGIFDEDLLLRLPMIL